RRGDYQAVARISFAEYTHEWLETFQGRTGRGIRPETLADYRFDLERDAIPFFGRMQLAAIEPRDLKRFVATLAQRGLSASSVRRRLYRGRFDAPKSRYALRSVPLSAGIAQQLWRLRGPAADEAPLFPSKIGSHLDQSHLFSRILKPAARRAGVPWAGFHTLR